MVGLSFDYGQRHTMELESAANVAKAMGLKKHVIAKIDLRVFGGSALTDDIDVPKGRSSDEMSEEIPVTYVPARNTIFLSFALAYAETQGATDIFIGVNALDFSGGNVMITATDGLGDVAINATGELVFNTAPRGYLTGRR